MILVTVSGESGHRFSEMKGDNTIWFLSISKIVVLGKYIVGVINCQRRKIKSQKDSQRSEKIFYVLIYARLK